MTTPIRNAALLEALDPDLFSHGRLLRRFPGSDAVRFSARLAAQLLDRIVALPAASGPRVLWDPFCGIGMIPCVTLAAFPGAFARIVASDLVADACTCARANLGALASPAGFARRRREVHGSRGANAGSDRRGAAVEAYMERIEPLLFDGTPRPRTTVLRCDAFRLPGGIPGDLHVLSDLPHGKRSQLAGAPLRELIPALRTAYPDAAVTFVTTRDAADELAATTTPVDCRDLAGGRVIFRA